MSPGSRKRLLIMGVINITPDSFSDGGAFFSADAACRHAEQLISDGADILDVGAESTRPGATSVAEDVEWKRLEPVLTRLCQEFPKAALSIDTRKPALMLRAASLGVAFINDVSGATLDDSLLRQLAARANLSFLAMHMHGTPATMQANPLTAPRAIAEVERFFALTQSRLINAGFTPERIWLDPGIGFGKSDAANWQLIAQIGSWASAYQLAVGVSRKGFIGRALQISEPTRRDDGTKMLEASLMAMGARLVRTHEVGRLARLRGLLGDAG